MLIPTLGYYLGFVLYFSLIFILLRIFGFIEGRFPFYFFVSSVYSCLCFMLIFVNGSVQALKSGLPLFCIHFDVLSFLVIFIFLIFYKDSKIGNYLLNSNILPFFIKMFIISVQNWFSYFFPFFSLVFFGGTPKIKFFHTINAYGVAFFNLQGVFFRNPFFLFFRGSRATQFRNSNNLFPEVFILVLFSVLIALLDFASLNYLYSSTFFIDGSHSVNSTIWVEGCQWNWSYNVVYWINFDTDSNIGSYKDSCLPDFYYNGLPYFYYSG